MAMYIKRLLYTFGLMSSRTVWGKHIPLKRLMKSHDGASDDADSLMKRDISVNANAENSSLPNSDTMRSINSIYYVGPVEVGGQNFQVIYDTGSNLLWVPSLECGTSCLPHPLFTGAATPVNENFDLQYGSGSASGEYAKAPVTLADASLPSFKVGLANDVNFEGYQRSQYDGLLGLAWPGLGGRQDVPSLVPSLYQAGQIPANLFTMYLAPDGTSGELSLGEIDTSRYQGNMTWLPLLLEQWWTVGLTGLKTGESTQVVSNSFSSPQTTIVDSGTSLIVGPNDQISNLMDSIQSTSGVPVYYDASSDMYGVYCSDVGSLPTLTFTLMGADKQQYHYTMPGSTYVLSSLSNDPRVCALAFQKSGGMSDGSVDWILGDPFLRTFYSVYDYENARVGLAAASPSAGSVVPGDKSALSITLHLSFTLLILVSLYL